MTTRDLFKSVPPLQGDPSPHPRPSGLVHTWGPLPHATRIIRQAGSWPSTERPSFLLYFHIVLLISQNDNYYFTSTSNIRLS